MMVLKGSLKTFPMTYKFFEEARYNTRHCVMHTIDVKLGAYTQFDIDGWKMSIVFVHAKIYWVVNQISFGINCVSCSLWSL